MRRALRIGLVGAAVVVTAVGAGIAVRSGVTPFPPADRCRAIVPGHVAELTPEQAQNAALIAAISVRRGLPPRAASIGLATALQESKLLNLEHGDRDSLGLFQQRPSQGWGTRTQILNPVYATNAFYDALERVDGYDKMDIGEAAQAVQRSAYPGAYDQHAADARALALTLTGETTGGGFSCVLTETAPSGSPRLNRHGLTRRADDVRRELKAVFGLPLGGYAPGGVTSGHMVGSAHYDGRAVDVFVRPITPANRARGWAVAAYLVAQAGRLHIQTVIFDGRIWTAGRRSRDGWRTYTVPEGSSGSQDVLEHRDQVHVDVAP
ncbi:MAG: hypothetical protein R2731_19175 [Nocardioides sp.]